MAERQLTEGRPTLIVMAHAWENVPGLCQVQNTSTQSKSNQKRSKNTMKGRESECQSKMGSKNPKLQAQLNQITINA